MCLRVCVPVCLHVCESMLKSVSVSVFGSFKSFSLTGLLTGAAILDSANGKIYMAPWSVNKIGVLDVSMHTHAAYQVNISEGLGALISPFYTELFAAHFPISTTTAASNTGDQSAVTQ